MIYDNLLSAPGMTYARTAAGTATTADGLIETFAANVPRRNTQGLLVEEARTNLLLRSQEFDNASWVALNVKNVSANAAVAPDGTTTADIITDNSAAAFHGVSQTVTVPNDSLTRTFSIYVKKTTGGTAPTFGVNLFYLDGSTTVTGYARLNTDTGSFTSLGTVSVVSVGNYWRLKLSLANNSTGNVSLKVDLYAAISAYGGGDNDTVTATGSTTIWGAQIETGTLASSYIPTTTVAVTRSMDSLTFVKALQNSVDFTVNGEVTFPAAAGNYTVFHEHDGTANNGVCLTRNSNGVVYPLIYKDGSLVAAFMGVSKPGAVSVKWAITRIAGVFAFYVDGAAIESISTTQLTKFTTTAFGRNFVDSDLLNGYIKSYNFSTYGVTPTQAIALTQPAGAVTNTTVPGYEALVRPNLVDIVDPTNALAFMNSGVELEFTSNYYRKGINVASAPLSLSGFTYTRAGTATAPMANGSLLTFAANVPRITDRGILIEEARTNLLLRSQEFDNASWTAITTKNVTANSAVAPDGTHTADTLTDNSAGTYQGAAQTVTVPNDSLMRTASIYVKKTTGGTAPTFGINIGYTGGTPVSVSPRLNTDTGAITSVANTKVTSEGGYWRLSVSLANNNTGNTSFNFSVYPAPAPYGLGSDSVTSTGSAIIWGAQIETGDFLTSYIPTTTASVTRAADIALLSATFSGARSVFVEAEFTEASSAINSGNRVLAGLRGGDDMIVISNRSGGIGAYVETALAAQGAPEVAGTVSVNTPFKAALNVGTNDIRFAKNGILGVADVSATITTSTALGIGCYPTGLYQLNGFVRSIVAVSGTSNNNQLQVRSNYPSPPTLSEALRPAELVTALDRGALYGIPGDTGFRDTGVEILFQTPYYRKGLLSGTSPNAVSLSHVRAGVGTASSVAGVVSAFAADTLRRTDNGVLIEQGSTNLLVRSEEMADAGWVKAGSTITANAVAAPDGTTTADKLVESAGGSGHYIACPPTTTSVQTYTLSVFAKAGERSKLMLYSSYADGKGYGFDLTGAGSTFSISGEPAPARYSIQQFANGWYRCSITFTGIVTTGGVGSVYLVSGTSYSYSGDGTSGLYLWGGQLEVGDYPTSYIPTTSAAVTREAGVTSLPIPFSPAAVFFQCSRDAVIGTNRLFELHNGSDNERMFVQTIATGQVYPSVTVGGVTPTLPNSGTGSVLTGTVFKGILRRSASGTYRMFLNGVAIGAESAAIGTPAVTSGVIGGRRTGGSEFLNGRFQKLVLFQTAPSDAQCIAMTT
jgi:hypothetical protein